jgi:hypothetical protein
MVVTGSGNSGSDVFNGAFADLSPDNSERFLGAERNINASGMVEFGGFYTGFIWQVCFYATYRTTIEIPDEISETPCGTGYCSTCPVEDCLIDCEVNEWLDDDTCVSCSTTEPACST